MDCFQLFLVTTYSFEQVSVCSKVKLHFCCYVVDCVAVMWFSVQCIEGTVKQLIEDKYGTVVGVEYKDKASGNIQVHSVVYW